MCGCGEACNPSLDAILLPCQSSTAVLAYADFNANCSLPWLSLSVKADSEDRFPSSGGSEPVRLKSVSSKTATDWEKVSVHPPARRIGVVEQQLTPYLQLRCPKRTV